ncbi:MAG: DUF2314 domain-containing protein [Pirellulaceae bacterium]|nr:DUF2314 domain-containing protein [Pirellulaceae bacterium]
MSRSSRVRVFPLAVVAALLLSDGETRARCAAEARPAAPANQDAAASSKKPPPTVIRRPGQARVVGIGDTDEAMSAAMKKAQDTLPTFLGAVRNPWPSQGDFQIKVRFQEDQETEWMWLSEVTYDGRELTGKLNSDPLYVKRLKRGDIQTVAPRNVVDWTFDEYGRSVGAFTEQVVRDQSPPDEQDEPLQFAEPLVRSTVTFAAGRGRFQLPEIFETGVDHQTGECWFAPRGKKETLVVHVSLLPGVSAPAAEKSGPQRVRALAETTGRGVVTKGEKTITHHVVRAQVNGKWVAKYAFLAGWDDHLAQLSAQASIQDATESEIGELLVGVFDAIHSLVFVGDGPPAAVAAADNARKPAPAALPTGRDAEPEKKPAGKTLPEVRAALGATRIFVQASGNKSRPAAARVLVPADVPVKSARISGEGHNQDRAGYLRTMEVKINGRVLKVIPALSRGQTKAFDLPVPPDLLVHGANDVQAYIEWSNDEYDRGHWVSLTLTLGEAKNGQGTPH